MKKLIVSMLVLALSVSGCVISAADIKPLPPGAIACHSDYDCPEGSGCWFSGDTGDYQYEYAQCIRGKDGRHLFLH